MRRILHIDMDAFFAAVEQKRRPELAGKPVVIGGNGDPTQRGVVSTASYEARTYGVHSAMPLRTAHTLCPTAVFLPVDYEEYSRISRQIKTVLKEFSHILEDVGIDEAFLDISHSEESAEAITRRIKERIREETGLTCSIGIAPNKLLAKIASDLRKPDGLTILTERDIEHMLWPLPVRKLWGIGPKTEQHLKRKGILTIGALAAVPLDTLVEEFGTSYGTYLFTASRGIDESPLVTRWEPKSMSRETTFQRDIIDWQMIAKSLAELTRTVVTDLRQSGYLCRSMTLKVRFHDFHTVTRSKTLAMSTDSVEEVRKALFECLKRIELKKRIRLLGVRVEKLEKGRNVDSLL